MISSRTRGFTLLEVMVALSILSMALMAIFDLNSSAVAMHGYAKRVTVASLLARSKMIDLEQKLFDEGFPGQDDEDSGDFSREGWPNFKWRARILAPRTTGVSTDKVLAALFNLPIGGEGGGDMGADALSALFGGGMPGGAGGAAGAAAGAAGGAAGLAGGAMAGLAQAQMTQFLDEITRTVREVHLTVTWKNGSEVETLDLVTHVVSMGPGSDRNGNQGTGTAAGGTPGQPDPWVVSATGDPIEGEAAPCTVASLGLCDPANPNVQVERRSAWVNRMRANSNPLSRTVGPKGWK